MRRHIPTTRALLAFDAVARHQSVGKAADELCLTHGAISQQLRLLEDQLGVRLVQRGARGSVLTEAGKRYHAQVAADLLRLENHTLEAMARRPGGAHLLIGALPVFGERWLLPRLPAFALQHPSCTMHLQVFPTHIALDEPPFDVAVQYDDAPWPGAQVRTLLRETCVVVCAPQSRQRAAFTRGDFRQASLLQLSSRLGAWEGWFAGAGIERVPTSIVSGHRFDLFSMLIEAVRADLGVGLVPQYAVQRELANGELVLAHRHAESGRRGYSVFVGPHKAADPLAAAFVDWLSTAAQGAD
ncbi:LysR family transcriptional regulator [Aquincola sp. S2]|uniref:LysR family transcriptional regulator n=1 Tax=Pseudaquabacterium terrae TaxID=2732868 RepID=A0ABX2ELG4_9BURK|nr:LysR substrate-binding domain-containing protein [Aquabacterium terrae]NRF69401.1 LysR family transcriptional regulator [Aquabacterium terrae]